MNYLMNLMMKIWIKLYINNNTIAISPGNPLHAPLYTKKIKSQC